MTPKPNMHFHHNDYPVNKRRRQYARLVIAKVLDDGKVVAHEAGTEPGADGKFNRVYCFPLGLAAEDTKWL